MDIVVQLAVVALIWLLVLAGGFLWIRQFNQAMSKARQSEQPVESYSIHDEINAIVKAIEQERTS